MAVKKYPLGEFSWKEGVTAKVGLGLSSLGPPKKEKKTTSSFLPSLLRPFL